VYIMYIEMVPSSISIQTTNPFYNYNFPFDMPETTSDGSATLLYNLQIIFVFVSNLKSK